MTKKTFRIVGALIDRSTGSGLADFRIEAWDKDLLCDDLVAGATSDAHGAFIVEFEESYFNELFLDRRPDLYFKIFNGRRLVASTERSVLWNVDVGERRLVIDVHFGEERPAGNEPGARSVRGSVLRARGGPLQDALVRAFDKDLRKEVLLGEASTDANGAYVINYPAKHLARPSKSSTDLLVRVFGKDGAELGASTVAFGAPADATVDVILGGDAYRGVSEYEQVQSMLAPMLGDVAPVDLTDDDFAHLVGAAQIPASTLQLLVRAAQQAKTTALPAEVFFGFGREGHSEELSALLALEPELQRDILARAIDDNFIPAELEERLDEIVARLQRATVTLALQPPADPAVASLASLLSVATPSVEIHAKVLTAFVERRAPPEEVWQSLRKQPDLQPGIIDDLQRSLQLGALTRNHLPLVRKLDELSRSGAVKSLRDLARLDRADWVALLGQHIDGRPIGSPADAPGASAEEKTENYAATLTRMLAEAFPTDAIASRIAKSPAGTVTGQSDFVRFFSNNLDFDLGATRIDRYLADTGKTALAGVIDPEGLTTRLKAAQRIFKVTSHHEEMQILLGAGLTSAQDIVAAGKGHFIDTNSGKLGSARAEAIFGNAGQITATALALFSKYSPLVNGVSLSAIPALDPARILRVMAEAGLPDFTSLFGSLDFCACEHCRSVYGPAAYFVDVLHFMGAPARARLLAKGRRPDLAQIQLSCDNTNVPLPYIDLVNEVLEDVVSPRPVRTDGTIDWPQTTWTANELAANPEHILPGAYDALAGAVYPWDLPFSLADEEARVYLNHLGTGRDQLMEIFRRGLAATGPGAVPSDASIARAHLALTPKNGDIVTGALAADPWRYWGYAVDPDGASWPLSLQPVPSFLARSGLAYPELLELLDSHFINPDRSDPTKKDAIAVQLDNGTCNLDTAKIINLTPDAADRVHRFVRLRRRLEWTTIELDRAISILSPGGLTEQFLLRLSDLVHVRSSLRMPVLDMLTFWGPLDTTPTSDNGPSPYEQLFQNKAVLGDDDRAVFALNADRSELASAGTEKISLRVPALLAALGVNAADLALLTDPTATDAINVTPELTNDALSLDNLSRLHRIVALAKGLRLSVRDFLIVKALTGHDPFNGAHVEDTRRFVDSALAIKASGIRIAELDYLLRHVYVDTTRGALTAARALLILRELQTGLKKIVADTTPAPDPIGVQTSKTLALLLPPDASATLDRTMAVIAGAEGLADATRLQILYDLAGLLDPAAILDAKSKLVGSGALTDKTARFAVVLDPLLAYLRRIQSEGFVKQKLGEALKLETSAISVLLTQAIASSRRSPDPKAASGRTALADFIDSDFIAFEGLAADADAFLPLFRTLVLVAKAALVVEKTGITTDELTFAQPSDAGPWIVRQGPILGWLDLNALPLDRAPSGAALYLAWERLQAVFTLRRARALDGSSLLGLLASVGSVAPPVQGDFFDALAALGGWSRDELEELSSASMLDLAYPNDFKDGRAFTRLTGCLDVMSLLGVAAKQIMPWAYSDALDLGESGNIKSAVKAKYDDRQWLAVAKPLRDVLREKQRSALVSYVLHLGGFEDQSALFSHYLLDVEMCACQATSRLKQAIGSAQLFVQRALMNLEQPLKLTADDAKRWTWMKSYRVWEANRKVFLYPENWIEPDLRDDMTPFFKDFQNELLQTDLTSTSAEDALLHYLEKLDTVARLQIAGVCRDAAAGILHVIGRTRATPPVYYHRTLVDETRWTPWMRLDLDIYVDDKGHDWVIPVVWNRRLHLFWAIFTEKADDNAPIPDANKKGSAPSKHFDIQLAWSERKHDKWTAKRVSTELLRSNLVPREGHVFTATVAPAADGGEDLTVVCTVRQVPTVASVETLIEPILPALATDLKKILGPMWTKSVDPDGDFPVLTSTRTYTTAVVTSDGGGNSVGGDQVKEDRSLEQPNPFLWKLTTTTTTRYGDGSQVGGFRLLGCGGTVFVDPFRFKSFQTQVPKGTVIDAMALRENAPDEKRSPDSLYVNTESRSNVELLKLTPGDFRLMSPHERDHFSADDPFFFEDQRHTFLVRPKQDPIDWPIASRTHPGIIDEIVARVPYVLAGPPAPERQTRDASVLLFASGAPAPAPTADLVESSAMTFAPPRTSRRIAFGESMVEKTPKGGGRAGAVQFSPVVLTRTYLFETFYHPYVGELIARLNRFGVDGVLHWPTQEAAGLVPVQRQHRRAFKATYAPTSAVKAKRSSGDAGNTAYPVEEIDFSEGGAYAQYNWEFFFHAPLMIADHLSKNQRFEEAQRWYHFIFDPTDASSYGTPQRYWKVRKFFDDAASQGVPPSIQELMQLLAQGGSEEAVDSLGRQITAWRENPFNPHLIARMRTVAYQKTTVMKYIDNLIAWGDQLFQRDTLEAINEATLLYVLAAEILGPRPRTIPPPTRTAATETYATLEKAPLDAFSNALVSIENHLATDTYDHAPSSAGTEVVLGASKLLYFCIPGNEQLVGYWDLVADRLFKIRHCMNIEGVVRQLPLFEPPIDPALLVRAAAAGVDLSSVLNDVGAPPPLYRFQIVAQKATELVSEVRALGASLLAALEKRDGEDLALLRAGQEIDLLQAVREVKQKQIAEALASLDGLNKARAVTETRRDYYRDIARLNANEQAYMRNLATAHVFNEIAQGIGAGVAAAHTVPNFDVGTAGWAASPVVTATFGGNNLGSALQAASGVLSMISAQYTHDATMASINGGYQRRWDDWKLQERVATKELVQIDRQIAAAEIRSAIAERELDNHDRQIDHSREVNEYLRSKFTSRELHDWMVSQLSAVYFQSYKLAYDMARKAERAFQFERRDEKGVFIKFGYWDSLKKGLLAGERLHYDLKRMEASYLEKNRRDFEITKHISLLELDPVAFTQLRENGVCFVELPESLFDADYPGHYLRRLKAVSVTIPCVVRPFTSVNCTVTLVKHAIRVDPDVVDDYPRLTPTDGRFVDSLGAIEAMVTSSGQNDSGAFELNLRDERYLPFEGAGAVGLWRIELPRDTNRFNLASLSDVVFHLRFTARDGGDPLRELARASLGLIAAPKATEPGSSTPRPAMRLFSAKKEFTDELYRFLHPEPTTVGQSLAFDLSDMRFPFHDPALELDITRIRIVVVPRSGSSVAGLAVTLVDPDGGMQPSQPLPPAPPTAKALAADAELSNLLTADFSGGTAGAWSVGVAESAIPAAIKLVIDGRARLDPAKIDDVLVLCEYELS